jgi:hypothetical protein
VDVDLRLNRVHWAAMIMAIQHTYTRSYMLTIAVLHQQKPLLSGWNSYVRVDALCQSRQCHPNGS